MSNFLEIIMTFEIIWYIVFIAQYFTVRRELIFAVLDFELNLDIFQE